MLINDLSLLQINKVRVITKMFNMTLDINKLLTTIVNYLWSIELQHG